MQINLYEEFGINDDMSRDELNEQIRVALQKNISRKNHPDFEKQRKANANIEILQRIKKSLDFIDSDISSRDVINTIQKAIDEDSFNDSFDFVKFHGSNRNRTKSKKQNVKKSDKTKKILRELILVNSLTPGVIAITVLYIGLIYISYKYSSSINAYKDTLFYLTILLSATFATIILENYAVFTAQNAPHRIIKGFSLLRYLADLSLCVISLYYSIKLYVTVPGNMGIGWLCNTMTAWGGKFIGLLDFFSNIGIFIIFAIPILILVIICFLVAPSMILIDCLMAYVHELDS